MLVLAVGSFLVGWVVRSLSASTTGIVPFVDRWVVSVALPAMVLSRMSRAEWGGDLVVPVLAAWGSMVACAAIVAVAARVRGWSRSTTGALLLVGVLGNTSFLGLAATEGILGADRLDEAIAYDQLGTFLALALWGSVVAGQWGSGEGGWRPVASRIVRFPPFLALVAASACSPWTLPEAVHRILDVPGSTTAPLAMFALGLRFSLAGGGVDKRTGIVALVAKMFVVPLAVLLVAVVAGDPGAAEWQVSVLQSAAPPMVSAGIVAAGAGLEPELVAWIVGTGTLLSFVALPLWGLAL